ncbi:MAG: tRNA (N(6)-L-threonylcarbamoyladenosine(37)-C(2))-methylthiotransferase MtaB [Candidatus Aminicenantes bacterium]|nr:tRNA (N(6)-L-threonylcarbamoyladenosine(37)-C(2))-methylthiotransferase MtaB [Candidatus Aminicenantes bacterium]
MTSFFIQSFGCRVNQAEAFAWADALEARGLRLAGDWSDGDLILVNSCTLTGRADRDVRKFVERVVRERPGVRLVVTGCLAERAPGEFAGRPEVSLVVRNSEKAGLPEKVLGLVGVGPAGAAEPTPFRSRALVKVQDGCDRRCTFCIVPSVRGRSASVAAAEVAATVRGLAERGYYEMVLAGIHLSSYGRDLEPPGSLAGLLEELGKVAGLGRLRLSSLDPRDLDQDALEAMTSNPKVCAHYHLSLQHASEAVLEKMGRPASEAGYRRLLETLREASPEAAIGADFIVGFPGERDEDFERLLRLVEETPLTYAHVFAYSPRQGTPAAGRPQVREDVKKRRSEALRKAAAEKNRRFRASFVGRDLEAVVIRGREGRSEGLSGNYLRISIEGSSAAAREPVRVRVTGLVASGVEGRPA